MSKRTAIWIKISVVTFCLAISLFLLWIFLPFSGDNHLDEEYAVLTANDTVVIQTYPIDHCDSIYFFADTQGKRTLFIKEIPNVKIVNDEEYYLELTTNKSIHDAMAISDKDGILVIDIQDTYYNRVHEDNSSNDYDYGLYVDCTVFDITIHAPISVFLTNTQNVLDFDVASAVSTFIDFSFEGTQANIYNIDTQDLTFYCSGSSDVSLRGSVSDEALIKIWHNTHVDATELITNQTETFVSNEAFGISYIRLDDSTKYSLDFGMLLAFILVLFPVFWLIWDIVYIRKLIKINRCAESM